MSIISQTSLQASSPDLLVPNLVCDPSVNVGDWVRWSGSTLVQAFADSKDDANVFGLVEVKTASTVATVRIAGVSSALFVGLDNSKEYFLSDITPGGMTVQGTNIPTAAGHVVLSLGQPLDAQRFLVQKGTRLVRS